LELLNVTCNCVCVIKALLASIFIYMLLNTCTTKVNSSWATQEILGLYRDQKFITLFTTTCHWALNWTSWIKFKIPYPTLSWSISNYLYTQVYVSWVASFLDNFQLQLYMHFSSIPCMIFVPLITLITSNYQTVDHCQHQLH